MSGEITLAEQERAELDLATKRAEAIEKDLCFTKTRIRDEFKMKPAPGTTPIKSFKNDYGGTSYIYRVKDCIPIKTVKKNPPSEKQIVSRKITSLQNRLRSKLAQTGKLIDDWIHADHVYLDTETTGLDLKDQIIELAIIDQYLNKVLDIRLKPTVLISPKAEQVHGISDKDLEGEISFPVIHEKLKTILLGQPVIIFNKNFDLRMLRQTAKAFDLETDWIDDIHAICAMDLSVQAFGSTNMHKTISLSDAMDYAGCRFCGSAHSARVDAIATADVINEIYSEFYGIEEELRALKGG